MIRLFREHPEFDEYSKFDTVRGELIKITGDEFRKLKDLYETFEGCYETHTQFPRRVYFQITRKCNLECDYCFIKAGKKNQNLDTNIILRLAEYFGKNGLMEVRLTGGEPTLHPDFIDIFNSFKENNVFCSISTNGMWSNSIKMFLFNEENLWVIVSIDGAMETHNLYRKNSYEIIINNLKELKSKNPNARLRLTRVGLNLL